MLSGVNCQRLGEWLGEKLGMRLGERLHERLDNCFGGKVFWYIGKNFCERIGLGKIWGERLDECREESVGEIMWRGWIGEGECRLVFG